jgi:putative glutamine amidotransferase
MSQRQPLPLVGVSACVKLVDGSPFHAVQQKYLDAVVLGARAQPVIMPALDGTDLDALVAGLDGILLTGSPSNVEPSRYGGPAARPGVPHDLQRDALTLPLIRHAIDAGLPLLAICRGFEELNVAYGGTLHQHLEELPGRLDHRADRGLPRDEQYAPRHPVSLAAGGVLARMAGASQVAVNSLHGQGINGLGPGLVVEATAPDGTIEAVRVRDARNFALGVQWHCEWKVKEVPLSAAIFAAFGDAVRQHAARKERIKA